MLQGTAHIAIMDNIDTKDGLSDFLPVQDWFNEARQEYLKKSAGGIPK